jgi:hypothetical protein
MGTLLLLNPAKPFGMSNYTTIGEFAQIFRNFFSSKYSQINKDYSDFKEFFKKESLNIYYDFANLSDTNFNKQFSDHFDEINRQCWFTIGDSRHFYPAYSNRLHTFCFCLWNSQVPDS